MPKVVFAPALARWRLAQPEGPSSEWSIEAPGASVREVLAHIFDAHPALRGYVWDDQRAIRHHVVVYVNNEAIRDKQNQSEPVPPDGEVYVFQALSGG